MSNQSPSNYSREPLSVGNVVSAGLRIYRDNFKSYLGISFKASLWVLFPFLGILVLIIILGIFSVIFGNNSLIIGLLIFISFIAWFYFLFYCVGKSLIYSALISKLTYQILINQPDSVSATLYPIQSKHWLFWRASVSQAIYLWLISLGLSIIQYIVFGLPAGVINNLFFSSIWDLIGNLCYLAAYTWFVARYFIYELPLVIENYSKATEAINRSWELTKDYANKILLIVTVAFLITIPVFLLAMIPLSISLFRLIPSLQNPNALIQGFGVIGLSFLVSIIIFIFLNIAALPFWQAIKAVIYYDIRSRKEGIELSLRDR